MDSPAREPQGAIEEANFIANMRKLREDQGLSQGELAQRMQAAGWDKFHQTTISRIEKGVQPVRLGEARGIADALGTLVGPMLLNDQISERWRELETATQQLIELGNLIGAGVADYLHQQTVIRDMIERQPPMTDDVHPATVAAREQALDAARTIASRSYSDWIAEAVQSDYWRDEDPDHGIDQ